MTPDTTPKRYGKILRLPDRSEVVLDYDGYSFQPVKFIPFYTLCEVKEFLIARKVPSPAIWTSYAKCTESLARRLRYPSHPFRACFRRASWSSSEPDKLFYFFSRTNAPVNIFEITSWYKIEGRFSGGMYSSSSHWWNLCDGQIGHHGGYGFGPHSRSYSYVRGYETLRAMCLFFGIRSPRYIKGIPRTKTDAEILIGLTRSCDTGTSNPAQYEGLLNINNN